MKPLPFSRPMVLARRAGRKTQTRRSFQSLWESLHGPDAWDANPWVWVLGLSPFQA